jgi:hypothetical protein
MMQHASDDRSLGELFSALARDTGQLVRKEVQLAKFEVTDKAKAFGMDGAMAVAGMGLVAIGSLTIYAGLILLIGTLVPLWASALIVGGLVALSGAALAYFGWRSWKQIDPRPHETIRTLKEDEQWLREQVSR